MSMNATIYAALKGATWEEAKGKLRALVAIQGSVGGRAVSDTSEWKWEALGRQVESFIHTVEDAGLHE